MSTFRGCRLPLRIGVGIGNGFGDLRGYRQRNGRDGGTRPGFCIGRRSASRRKCVAFGVSGSIPARSCSGALPALPPSRESTTGGARITGADPSISPASLTAVQLEMTASLLRAWSAANRGPSVNHSRAWCMMPGPRCRCTSSPGERTMAKPSLAQDQPEPLAEWLEPSLQDTAGRDPLGLQHDHPGPGPPAADAGVLALRARAVLHDLSVDAVGVRRAQAACDNATSRRSSACASTSCAWPCSCARAARPREAIGSDAPARAHRRSRRVPARPLGRNARWAATGCTTAHRWSSSTPSLPAGTPLGETANDRRSRCCRDDERAQTPGRVVPRGDRGHDYYQRLSARTTRSRARSSQSSPSTSACAGCRCGQPSAGHPRRLLRAGRDSRACRCV